MNSITDLLDLEDTDIIISNIQIHGQTKIISLETPSTAHFCPSSGFRMHSRGVKKRTIKHPILQDNYALILIPIACMISAKLFDLSISNTGLQM